MVLNFFKTLDKALETIGFTHSTDPIRYHVEHDASSASSSIAFASPVSSIISSETQEQYSVALWGIIRHLNEAYEEKLEDPFDLENWVFFREDDEVSFFLAEAGTNCFNYAQGPYTFHLYKGSKGFVLAVEHSGEGFDAAAVNEKRLMSNEGAAFRFFREAQGTVFFDNSSDAKIVYFEYLF